MGAYFSGDVFTQVRGRKIPVARLDLGGAYPVAHKLADVWALQAAKRIQVRHRKPEATEEYVEALARRVQGWWNGATSKLLTASDWARLSRTIVWVVPRDDWLPHRPRTGDRNQGTQMLVGPLTSSRPLPYYLTDVLGSHLRTGRMPKVVRAIRLVPIGRQSLKPVGLPTGRIVDPMVEDPIFALAEEKARLEARSQGHTPKGTRIRSLLKRMAVSAPGLAAQVLDEEPTSKPLPIWVWDPLNPDMDEPTAVGSLVMETPGPWYFPPVAGAVSSTARLLLYLCRGAFEATGGTVAYWDTDSLMPIATPFGGEVIELPGGSALGENGRPGVVALGRSQVVDVAWKIEDAISPYPPDLRPYSYGWDGDMLRRAELPGLLRLESENQTPAQGAGLNCDGPFLDVNRAKRHRTYHVIAPGDHVEIRDREPQVILATPDQVCKQSRVVVTSPSRHGITYATPDDAPETWFEDLTETLIEEHLQIGQGFPPELDWRKDPAVSLVPATRVEATRLHPQARPNSRLEVATSIFGTQVINSHPAGEWHEPDTGRSVILGTGESPTEMDYQVPRSYELEVRINFAAAPTHTLTVDSEPVGRRTYGVLRPAPTIATSVQLIGREARRWKDGRGILTPPEVNVYVTSTDAEAVAALVRKHYWWRGAACEIARKTGLTARTVSYILAGGRPSPRTATILCAFAYQQRLFDLDP
jgi:hypothetical protein